MSFKETRIGDVLTFQRGFDITKAEQTEGEIPIVSSSGTSSYHNHWKVAGRGIVIGRKGTLGTTHFLRENFWPHDTTLWIKDFKKNDPKFLYYFLQTLHFENFDTGSSNPTLNRNHLHKITVRFPRNVETQKKIAAILSAYDDLIANNQRRIALLERMAEDIYREWFVRLHFPGRDELKTEKGVPLGWKRVSLGSLGTYLNGYAFDPTEWFSEGVPIIKIREMTSGVTADTPRNPGEAIQKRYHFDNGEIIFSWSATLLVKIWDQGPGLLNQHLFKVTPNQGVPKSFLFFSVHFSLPIFEALTTGSTMKHIKRKELETVKVLLPSPDLLEKFDSLAAPLLTQMLDLTRANRNLATTRDALLPRLISGKLAVNGLNIRFPPGMAAG